MKKQVLVAGGGIGGVAAALGAARAGWEVRLYERAEVFSEFGAGVQLSPNVVRCLQAWGLQAPLQAVAAFPERLRVRCATSGDVLATLPLGGDMVQRYGAAYATIHRADLHTLLLNALAQEANVQINLGQAILGYTETATKTDSKTENAVLVHTSLGKDIEGDALIGADGLRSKIRAQLLADGPPRASGHLAYRALLPQSALPEALRSNEVTAWMGPHLHAVQYPVRGGELQNLVVIIEGPAPGDLDHWDHAANAADLERALRGTCSALQEVVRHVCSQGHDWRLWPLSDRAPVSSAAQMASGLVALLGDAAHPMRPYLAQGAGMAIEDAAQLQRALSMHDLDVALRLRRYALNRWERNARVQARAQRNGRIFHATGPLRWGRDAGLRLLGSRLLDVPWLYRGGDWV